MTSFVETQPVSNVARTEPRIQYQYYSLTVRFAMLFHSGLMCPAQPIATMEKRSTEEIINTIKEVTTDKQNMSLAITRSFAGVCRWVTHYTFRGDIIVGPYCQGEVIEHC